MRRIIVAVIVVALVAIAGAAEAKKKNVIRVPGGTNIAGVGLVIDASYDPRLDTLIPGYKVINVAVINQSLNVIQLDPERDTWEIRLSGEKRPIRAINNLRTEAPQAWARLPQKVRDAIDYPLVLPIGAQEVIDLFVPEIHDLELFTEVDISLRYLGGKLEIVVRE